MKTVACNLCRRADFEVVFAHRSGHVASGVCRGCGLAYLSPRPEPQEVLAFYGRYEQSYPDEALLRPGNPFEATAGERAEFVTRFIPPGRVIEVGAGYGHFLRAMRERGWAVTGIEPSAPEVRFAKTHFGLEMIGGTAGELGRDASADLIALFHVIEHLDDPLGVLEAVASTLKPQGYVLLDLPNALLLPANAIEHFYVVTAQHLSSFTPRVLRAMLAAAGLETVLLANHPLAAVYPSNLRAVARRARSALGPVSPDPAESLAAIRRYHAGLAELGARIDRVLSHWRERGARVAVYGAGFHTQGLLDLCDFSGLRLELIVDDDVGKHGSSLQGVPVGPAQEISRRGIEAVLVSSLAAEAAIAKKLEPLRRAGVEVALVYGGEPLPPEPFVDYLAAEAI